MDTILLFGGSGCLGKQFINRYVGKYNIVNFSRDEHKHWQIDQDIGAGKVQHVIGDAIDSTLVKKTLLQYKPTRIYIMHALKHIDRCQVNVHSCIRTNLLSIMNVLDCIHEVHNQLPQLKTVCFTSTDKAPSPINVYGMCKAISEELMVEKARQISNIKFIIVRYGNVLNSTSSLIPALLRNQSNTYQITDKRMTRFWMTIDQACDTIEYACEHGLSGEIIIPKVKSFYVKDIIEHIANLKGKQTVISGLRPGERLYETLINDTQSMRTYELDSYYHIKPHFIAQNDQLTEPFVYDSNTDLITDKNELSQLFKKLNIVVTH